MPAHIRVALLAALLMLAVYTAFAAIRLQRPPAAGKGGIRNDQKKGPV